MLFLKIMDGNLSPENNPIGSKIAEKQVNLPPYDNTCYHSLNITIFTLKSRKNDKIFKFSTFYPKTAALYCCLMAFI
jgi:hypothetical protein